MPVTNAKRNSAPAQELDLVRTFDAPRELVWKAWTDPQHLAMWWGPHGFSNPVCEVDVRVGGAIHIEMRGPDGTIYPNDGEFVEVVPPERLAFTSGVTDLFEVLTTVTLTERGGRTTVAVNARVLKATGDAAPFLAGMEAGWSQSLERLAEVTTPTANRELFATRLYAAPRALVFRMWTEPEHLAKWWGPNGFTSTIGRMDVRPGGDWELVMHGPDGRNYDNRMKYVEVDAPNRLVYDHDSHPPFRATVTFEDAGPYTKVSMHMLFATIEQRDQTIRVFGAAEGLVQTLGRLDKELQHMSSDKPFVISRTFNAPRDLMWKAWTETDRMAQWFGPKGVKIVKSNNDLRPGGVYHYGMQTPDGNIMWGKWIYREITKPERLVFVNSFSDENGGTTRHPMAANWPLEMLSTITFTESGGKTTVTVQWEALNATEAERATFEQSRDGMMGGWSGTFEQLEQYLATVR